MFGQICTLALAAVAAAHPVLEARQSTYNESLENFIARQYNVSLAGAIINIGGANNNVVEAAGTGFVVASPSTINPDYL